MALSAAWKIPSRAASIPAAPFLGIKQDGQGDRGKLLGLLQLRQLGIGQNRRLLNSPDGSFPAPAFQQIALAADGGFRRSNDRFPNGVDGRVSSPGQTAGGSSRTAVAGLLDSTGSGVSVPMAPMASTPFWAMGLSSIRSSSKL